MNSNPKLYEDICTLLRVNAEYLAKVGIGITFHQESFSLTNREGRVIYSLRMGDQNYNWEGSMHEDVLADFIDKGYRHHFEQSLFSAEGESITLMRDYDDTTSWQSRSRFFEARTAYFGPNEFPLFIHVIESGIRLVWYFCFERLPTELEIVDVIEQVHRDVTLRHKFMNYLQGKGVGYQTSKHPTSDNTVFIDPVVVSIQSGTFSIHVVEPTADFDNIISTINLIRQFHAEPDRKPQPAEDNPALASELELE